MDPSTFLGSAWGIIWRVKYLLRQCLDPYVYIYIYTYITHLGGIRTKAKATSHPHQAAAGLSMEDSQFYMAYPLVI